ncbi:MAG TPA: cupin domain-containing protein [Cellulomonas sp.]
MSRPAGVEADIAEDEAFYREIGRVVRTIRGQRGLSLAALAAGSGLSQSFLSQMERGLVRASYLSLNRVARALGTSTQELMGMGAVEAVSVVRAAEGEVFDDARLLVRGGRALRAIEFAGVPYEFGDLYAHAEEELLYVADGVIEVETDDGDRVLLGRGDTVYLSPHVRHRWRRVGVEPLRVVMVSQVLAPPPGD